MIPKRLRRDNGLTGGVCALCRSTRDSKEIEAVRSLPIFASAVMVAAPVIPKRLRRGKLIDNTAADFSRSTRDSKEIEAADLRLGITSFMASRSTRDSKEIEADKPRHRKTKEIKSQHP